MVFLVLFLIPIIVIACGAFITKRIDWQEFLMMLAAQAFVAGVSCGVISCQNTTDTQVINGEVTGKEQNRVHCRHSYRCNCRTTFHKCGKSMCSSTVCQTCYEHSHDFDWDVYSNIGTFTIDTIDRQGLYEPPRWTAVKMSEPVSKLMSYDNYVKASPDTLFRNSGTLEKYQNAIPDAPMRIYDYYRLDRFVQVGTNLPNARAFNTGLSEINKKLGPAHQANVILVTTTKPREYFYALRQAWIGGKNNDVIAVVGFINGSSKPAWAEIMAWDLDKRFDISLRNKIMGLDSVTPDNIIPILNSETAHYYKRQPMKDFEYLASIIKPSETQWYITVILGIFVAIGQVFFYSRHDVNGPWMPQANRNRYYGRRY